VSSSLLDAPCLLNLKKDAGPWDAAADATRINGSARAPLFISSTSPLNPLSTEAQAPYSSTSSLALATPKNTVLLIPSLGATPKPLFADANQGDTLVVSASSVPPIGAGKVVADAKGDVTFIPKNNFKGILTFTLQAQDAGGELSGQVATVVVVGEWVVVISEKGVDQGLSALLGLLLFLLVSVCRSLLTSETTPSYPATPTPLPHSTIHQPPPLQQ